MPERNTNLLARNGISISALAATLAIAGCTAGDGKGLDGNGGQIPDNPPVASDFQTIQDTIFTPICTACHIGATAPQGLRLDAANSYALLVNVASNEVPGTLRVNPGNPDTSYIVQKLQGNAAVGARMPFGGPYLSQAQIDLVRGWIAAGALPPPAAGTNNFVVTSTVPGSAEVAAGVDKVTVIFNAEVNASLVDANTFALKDGFDAPVEIIGASVPPGRPTVVELKLARMLPAGSYQLEVRGSGPVAIADNAGRALEGDFLMSFDVQAGAVR